MQYAEDMLPFDLILARRLDCLYQVALLNQVMHSLSVHTSSGNHSFSSTAVIAVISCACRAYTSCVCRKSIADCLLFKRAISSGMSPYHPSQIQHLGMHRTEFVLSWYLYDKHKKDIAFHHQSPLMRHQDCTSATIQLLLSPQTKRRNE